MASALPTGPRRASPPSVVLAILTVSDGYALQLRDNSPAIALPGHWSLFGGAIDEDESAPAAVRREIREELSLDVTEWRDLWRVRYYVPFWDAVILHRIFAADVSGVWESHQLREGQAAGVFPIDRLPEPMPPIASALLERYHAEQRSQR